MFLILIAAGATALAPNSTIYSEGPPPERFQKAATLTLELSDQAGIDRKCQALFGRLPDGLKANACHTGDRVIMPNPCSFPQTETYARLLCHELGHENGWPATHGDDVTAERAPAAPDRRTRSGS